MATDWDKLVSEFGRAVGLEGFAAAIESDRHWIADELQDKARTALLDAIKALEVERDALRVEASRAVFPYNKEGRADDFKRLKQAEAERDALKVDAERYRFIRDADRSDCITPELCLYAMESLDEYVDAAMEDEARAAIDHARGAA